MNTHGRSARRTGRAHDDGAPPAGAATLSRGACPAVSVRHRNRRLHWNRWLLVCALAGVSGAHAQDAQALRARYAALRDQLASSPLHHPVHIESSATSNALQGDTYAVIDQPFPRVGAALSGVQRWCDILILHLNVKGCRASAGPAGDTLVVHIGRKYDQPLEDAYRVEFAYRALTAQADYLEVQLSADEGPMGTHDYRLSVEVGALDARRSFLHMAYAYGFGVRARIAMHGYLATIGRNKVGFTVTGRTADGQPEYVGGTRGVIERNTMRYLVAIEAYLDAPGAGQTEERLNAWFTGIERYPRQLHELERESYLAMKRKEIARQKAGAASPES